MARHKRPKVTPVTADEVMAALANPRSIREPQSAGELAWLIWRARGAEVAPEVRDRHVRTVVEQMVADGTVVKAVGKTAARRMGRLNTPREGATYYDTAERGNAKLREAEERGQLRDQATALLSEILRDHPAMFTYSEVVGGGNIRMTMSLEQARKLMDRLKPQRPSMGQ